MVEEALGYRSLERQTPTTLDTIYRLFSATKPFTAVTALSLVDEGKLGSSMPHTGRAVSAGIQSSLRVYVSGSDDDLGHANRCAAQ